MFRDILDIYNRNIISIITLSLVLVIPVNIATVMFILYVSGSEQFRYPSLVNLCILLINFIILFPPFSLMVMNDLEDKDTSLKDCLFSFIHYFSFLLVFTIMVYLLSLLGAVFLFIPTLIGAVYLFLIPVFIHSNSVKVNFLQVWNLFKNENIFIVFDMIMLGSLQLLVWLLAAYLIDQFENNVIVYISLKVLVNTILFPFFYIYITRKYSASFVKTSKELSLNE